MLNIKTLIRFFDTGFVLKLLFLCLFYSLIPLIETFFLLYLSVIWGKYLTLALAASTGLVGLFFIFCEIRGILSKIKEKIKEGCYPEKDFISLAGTFAAGILLLSPGFITDFIGLLLFLPFFRSRVGMIIIKRMDGQLKDIYEYLRLYEI